MLRLTKYITDNSVTIRFTVFSRVDHVLWQIPCITAWRGVYNDIDWNVGGHQPAVLLLVFIPS